MKIDTLRFGSIDVQEDKIITFPNGIMGFDKAGKFILFPHKEGSPFYWLQSVDVGDLAFVVMSPMLVVPDYHLDIKEDALHDLGVADSSDLEVMCIVTIPRAHPEAMTINLLGPIIIATSRRVAVQVISDRDYSHQHPVVSME
ncbi:MAG: flagellar assembly protein FliW [Thermodesulfobacteriota bacterium]|nr:flagellar assembly protein FliW [Thermodesulfobacteriota bacterium]